MKGGVKIMTISELQKNILMNNADLTEFKKAHPKQLISSEIPIPIWKITYRYSTQRNNIKTAVKYAILDENSWDLIDSEFQNHISEINEKHPERKVSNVEILDTEFMGEVFLQLE